MRVILFAIFGVSLLSLAVNAEDIQLKDGTKISGKVIGINGDTFQVKTAYGDIKVPRSEVVTITFPENQPKQDVGLGAPPIDESLDGTSYINHAANFAATVPKGWAVAPELRKTKDIVAALKSPDQALFFMVTTEQFAGNLATYQVLVETQVRTRFKEYQRVTQSDASIDGKNGTRLILQATSPDLSTPFKFIVYLVPYDDHIIRLTFFTLEPLFSDAVPTFEKIAASYHTIKTGGTVGD